MPLLSSDTHTSGAPTCLVGGRQVRLMVDNAGRDAGLMTCRAFMTCAADAMAIAAGCNAIGAPRWNRSARDPFAPMRGIAGVKTGSGELPAGIQAVQIVVMHSVRNRAERVHVAAAVLFNEYHRTVDGLTV